MIVARRVGLLAFCGAVLPAFAAAATPIAPPAMYPSGLWQGRTRAVVRVLDRVDSHLETVTVPVGETGSYRTLSIAVQSCVSRPRTLSPDFAAKLHLTDSADTGRAPFDGWMLANEPSLGTYGSPLYDVRVVSCEGEEVAPQVGPLPEPAMPSLTQAVVPTDEGGDQGNVTPLPAGNGNAGPGNTTSGNTVSGDTGGGPVPLAPPTSAPIPLAPEGLAPQQLAPPSSPPAGQALPPPVADPGLE